MKVLVPTEGSDFSRAAIKECCKMFDESENTEIEVFAVAEPAYTPPEPFAVSASFFRDLDATTLKRANEAVAQGEADIEEAENWVPI